MAEAEATSLRRRLEEAYEQMDEIYEECAAESSLAEAKRLLKPFADAADCHSDDKEFMPDAMEIWRGGDVVITLGDLRAARFLSQESNDER
jgi:hypothetical protein